MTAAEGLLAGPAGDWLVILGMALATFACRSAGVLLMARVTITPRVERALRALPGSIVVATILPVAVQNGPSAVAGLCVALATMAFARVELVAVAAGLGTVAALRAAGL